MPRYEDKRLMPQLRSIEGTGEGDVFFPKAWKKQDALYRADLLRDWVHDITKVYNETVIELHKEFEAMVAEARARREAE